LFKSNNNLSHVTLQ